MLERLSGWIVGSTELGGVTEPKSKCNQGNNGAHKSRSNNLESRSNNLKSRSNNHKSKKQQPQIRVILPESEPTTQVTEDCLR